MELTFRKIILILLALFRATKRICIQSHHKNGLKARKTSCNRVISAFGRLVYLKISTKVDLENSIECDFWKIDPRTRMCEVNFWTLIGVLYHGFHKVVVIVYCL